MTSTALAIEWKSVRGVIFDMDGTLYRQEPVRLRIAFQLLLHAIQSRNGWLDLLVLKDYRRNRDLLAETRAFNVSDIQFKATAQACKLPEDRVAKIVHEWMNLRPLHHLSSARYTDIDRVFSVLKSRGVKIGVYSDYPVKEKMNALGLEANALCCSTEEGIDRLKPEPAGLIKTIKMLGLTPKDCVMIGDRADRDGLCAQNASVKFLLCKDPHFYSRLLVDLSRS